jgi:hypothetical protein
MSRPTQPKRYAIIGLQGSGKTENARSLAAEYIARGEGVLVFDPLHEFNVAGCSHYYPKNRQSPTVECEKLIEKALIAPYRNGVPLKKRYRLFVIDEASRVYPHGIPLPDQMGMINDTLRHYQLSLVTISRRAVQQHVDFLELAHELRIYLQTGVNDVKRLDDLKMGLGDMVQDLEKYYWVQYEVGKQPRVMPPVKMV